MIQRLPYRDHPGPGLSRIEVVLGALAMGWTLYRQAQAWPDVLAGWAVACAGLRYFRWRASACHAALDARAALRGMYRGEFGKMLISVVGLGLIFRLRGGSHAGYVLLGFALPQTGMWWLLLGQSWRRRQTERADRIQN